MFVLPPGTTANLFLAALAAATPHFPQIPRRRQTYSAVIDGRSAKKGCGEGEGSTNGLLTRKPASASHPWEGEEEEGAEQQWNE